MSETEAEAPTKGLTVETSTAIVTVVSIIAGAVLIALGHADAGAALLTFATGAAMLKPIVRRKS